ncbi:MAG: hypothetical protein J6113_06315 [Lachnospiraceae bacterium]|nr:hypothetical protein [Lachnospiraceae bacterium]
MAGNNWYRTDNVAKVFLASVSKRDTRTFRVSCVLKEPIDPELLQSALLLAIQDRPQVQVRIRRGFFWHYIEDTDIKPVVKEENGRMCELLYSPAKASLHYQVSYFGNRINLEIFHALTDGTGALEFLNIIAVHYLKLKYPGNFEDVVLHSGASADDLTQDSYRQFFGNLRLKRTSEKYAYHPGGFKLPYDQLQFLELHMSTSQVLAKAKSMGVSLTSFLGAVWMTAIRDEMPARKRKKPVTISIPVNLRNYYPSKTSRNFFNNINITHVFDKDITLEELAKEFQATLKEQLSEENIKKNMDRYETMEFVAPIRAVPLFIKQFVVRNVTAVSDRKVSMVMSNLGVQKPPAEIGDEILSYSGFCSSNNLFSTIFSYRDELTLGVTSPYFNTTVVKNFVRSLVDMGIEIKVYATEVVR